MVQTLFTGRSQHRLAIDRIIRSIEYDKSGRLDLNQRPLEPHSSALAGLRYAPL